MPRLPGLLCRCSVRVYKSGAQTPTPCRLPVTSEYEGEPYCGTHNPEHLAVRELNRRAFLKGDR